MKRFYYKVENTTKNPSIYGGRKQQATIYQIKKGKLVKIGKTRVWNTASYRGSESEVNEWLLENKIIPKIWSTVEGDWCEKHKCKGGYYTPYYYINDKYSINEI
jgi:hypothetical protein